MVARIWGVIFLVGMVMLWLVAVTPFVEALMNAFLLASLSTPLLYYWIIQPLILGYSESGSHLQRENEALVEAQKSAEDAVHSKDDFLASISHELRTPLTSIIGNSEYLLEQENSPETVNVLQTIESAGKAQLALVNDVLDMSKIQSGKFSIDEFAYDLTAMVTRVEKMISVRARDAGLRLEVKQVSTERVLLLGDANRISQILINLLTNAIKFTESGEVHLTSWNDNNQLHFRVEDSGIGMSPETLGRLFNRFEQADGSISTRFGGSGLGLYISRNLAEMMGGTIDASSKEGVGSTFHLTLPYKSSDISTIHSEQGEDEQRRLAQQEKFRGRVLIAEDTPELQLLERRILEGLGITVEVANDGVEAVTLAEQHAFDLILMDMQMPKMDGIQATKVLRERRVTTPVVALTANVMEKHRDSFSEAGCDGFLSKPIDRQELRKVLKQYLKNDVDRASLEREGKLDQRVQERRAAVTAITGEEIKGRLRHRRLRDRVDEAANQQPSNVDELINDELRAFFMSRVKVLKTELETAYENRAWEDVRGVAHTIKGSGTSFGFPQLTEFGSLICNEINLSRMDQATELTERLMTELDLVMAA